MYAYTDYLAVMYRSLKGPKASPESSLAVTPFTLRFLFNAYITFNTVSRSRDSEE